MDHTEQLKNIWDHLSKSTPVIFRPDKGRLRVRLPYSASNRQWLKEGHPKTEPVWNSEKNYWCLPKRQFDELVNKCLEKHRKVYVIQPYLKQEKCVPACKNANGHECKCSCMGKNHGIQGVNSDWLIISNAFAAKFTDNEYACRLLSRK